MKKIIYFVGIALILSACSIESDYLELKGEILEIVVSDTLVINQTAVVEIHFSGGTNGCASPAYLNTDWEGENILVEAFYYFPKNPEVCADYIPTHVLSFNILPDKLGELTIKANDAGEISKSILVVTH